MMQGVYDTQYYHHQCEYPTYTDYNIRDRLDYIWHGLFRTLAHS